MRAECTQLECELHKATVRWYVETLVSDPLPSDPDRLLLQTQFGDLSDYAAEHLRGQFPFLDKTRVQEAQTLALRHFRTFIDAPLVPVFRRPLSQDQIHRAEANWAASYPRWLSIWRTVQDQVASGRDISGAFAATYHPHTTFVLRCLSELPATIWPVLDSPPGYVLQALTNLNHERAREALMKTRMNRPDRAGTPPGSEKAEEVEGWAFILTALFETRGPDGRASSLPANQR